METLPAYRIRCRSPDKIPAVKRPPASILHRPDKLRREMKLAGRAPARRPDRTSPSRAANGRDSCQLIPHLTLEPGFGELPFPLDGGGGDSEYGGCLLDVQAGEKTQLH